MNDHVKWLEVENMGAFEKLHVDFNPQTNIIIGGNGTGKTSILRMLTLCMTNSKLEETRRREGASLHMGYLQDDQDIKIGAKFNIQRPTDYMKASSYDLLPEGHNEQDNLYSLSNVCRYKMLAIGAHRYFTYIPIQGMKKEEPTETELSAYRRNNPTYLDRPDLPAIKQWMINRYFMIDKPWGADYKSNWESIISKLNRISPTDCLFEFYTIQEDFEPRFLVNGKECFLEELSSGYKSILSIIFSITDWIEGVNEGADRLIEKAQGTVLIDEVDVHLHPEWQARIMGILRAFFPQLQFIVTTHSPYVIASANANEVIRIEKLTDDMQLKPSELSYAGWQLRDIVYDLMGMPTPNTNVLTPTLKKLNKAYKEHDIDAYDASLGELKLLVGPRDTIFSSYEFKRAEILLER